MVPLGLLGMQVMGTAPWGHADCGRSPITKARNMCFLCAPATASQGDYNTRHRRLCSGPFRNRLQLQRFSSVVVER